MPNKVEAGMRFRRKDDGKTFTAVREWGKGRSSINGQPDWYVEEDDSHRSLSSDDLYQPIPEPALELCAFPGCAANSDIKVDPSSAKEANDVYHLDCGGRFCGECHGKRQHPRCHDFVAPQAKPLIVKPADVYAGPPITGTFHNVQAKPVLREPKPRADGYPDVCLACRGDKGGYSYACWPCYERLLPEAFYAARASWDALHRQPAAKDIPSPAVSRPVGEDTEAARGGEAAITKRICKRHGCTTEARPALNYCGPWCASWPNPPSFERGPSATAHAPAAPGIEPWRPTVDELHWIPDAVEGWRR